MANCSGKEDREHDLDGITAFDGRRSQPIAHIRGTFTSCVLMPFHTQNPVPAYHLRIPVSLQVYTLSRRTFMNDAG